MGITAKQITFLKKCSIGKLSPRKTLQWVFFLFLSRTKEGCESLPGHGTHTHTHTKWHFAASRREPLNPKSMPLYKPAYHQTETEIDLLKEFALEKSELEAPVTETNRSYGWYVLSDARALWVWLGLSWIQWKRNSRIGSWEGKPLPPPVPERARPCSGGRGWCLPRGPRIAIGCRAWVRVSVDTCTQRRACVRCLHLQLVLAWA